VALLDSLLQSNGVRLSESGSAYYFSANDPDYHLNREGGFRRLTKVQNDRDLLPLEQQRQTEIALFL
jgi:hypothetical protein